MSISSPIKRHGGKAYLAKRVRELFPEHTRFAEPYFGSGAVLFAGDGKGVAEFANDLDSQLMTFWEVLQQPELFERFQRLCEATPFSQTQFEQAKSGDSGDLVTRAWKFFVTNRQSRQALGRDFATPTTRLRRGMNEQVSAWLTAVEGLPAFHARLRRVEIRCENATDFIRKLDDEATLFYCDPPYVHETRSSTGEYRHEMSREHHTELLDLLGSIKGKFLLSGYSCPLYGSRANRYGWRRIQFDLPNNASSSATKERKTEILWMNFSPT